MNERTKKGFEILSVAAILGVLGDVLLRSTPWGLNVLVFNLSFTAGMILLLLRHAPERLSGQTYALLGALVFFASMFVWRDAIEIRVADTFAILVILGVLFLPTLKVTAKIAGVFQYGVGVIWAAANSIFAPVVLLASDIGWGDIPMTGWRKHSFAVLRSLAIVTPLILIFGALFMAADAVYDGWVRKMLNIDFGILISHGMLAALFAWLTAGYFRGAVFTGAAAAVEPLISVVEVGGHAAQNDDGSMVDRFRAESGEHAIGLPDNKTVVEHINTSDAPNPKSETRPVGGVPFESNSQSANTPQSEKKPAWSWANIDNSIAPGFTLGSVEVGVVLGMLNLLFLSFVIFQVPYLFGGMDLVQNTPDFKLAEYARRGFGELVAVSALVLPILLASHWLIKKENPFTEKLFRVLAGIQIVLLFVIMASAVQRLVLLTGNLGYGLTTIRLYPMIFMSWLAIVFVLFGGTVLRGARRHFAWAALWSALLMLAATHVLNPDAFIVKTNIALMHQGREFDAGYNAELSQDSIPVLIDALSQLSVQDQCTVRLTLWGRLSSRHEQNDSDLRSWNWSRHEAAPLLIENTRVLHYDDMSGINISECSKSSMSRQVESVP